MATQAELWAEHDFAARRTALAQVVPCAAMTPVRKSKVKWQALPLGDNFIARRTALLAFNPKAYEQFCRFLRDELWVDQYIRCGEYRLEYIAFQHGAPQYRIYRGNVVWYVTDTKPKKQSKQKPLADIQREVAAYAMSVYGFGLVHSKTHMTRISPLARKYPRTGSWCEKQAS